MTRCLDAEGGVSGWLRGVFNCDAVATGVWVQVPGKKRLQGNVSTFSAVNPSGVWGMPPSAPRK